MALSDAQIAGAAKAAGFTGNDVAIAVAVALAESGGNPTATHKNSNGSTDYGLFQINSIHKALLAGKNWQDPGINASMAYQVFADAKHSWRPWATFTSGKYLAYLTRGRNAAGNPSDAPSSGTTTASAASDPTAGLSTFTNPGLWARVGVFLMGGALLVFALWKLTGAGDKVISIARTAIKARTGVSV